MKVEYIEETTVRKALAFEIEPEVVQKEIDSRSREYARKVKLPGFRPGKIPPEVIKKRFQSQVLEDVAESLVNKVVFEELEGRGLKPLASPKVTDLKIDEGLPMTFRVVFETLPIVEVPEYKGLPAKARQPKVADEDLQKELERLREDAARFDPVEGRPAQKADFVLLDLAWRPADGGKGGRDENAMIEVGGEGNHPKLAETLEGMSVGETREVRLDYPATVRGQDDPPEGAGPARDPGPTGGQAGKSLDYTVTLKAVKQKVLPALDDEFAKDLGDLGSLAELKDEVRQRLLSAEERAIDREVKSALVEALAQRASFEVPEALVERHMSARTETAARGLAYQGIDPTKINVDWRQYREAQRDDSLTAAKADILLDEIARREGVEALPAEVDAEIARMAERVRSSPGALRAKLEKEGDLPALRARIREEKTLDLLKANARLEFE